MMELISFMVQQVFHVFLIFSHPNSGVIARHSGVIARNSGVIARNDIF